MREKLIELLSENFSEYAKITVIAGTCKITAIKVDADKFADHLIANGVTIPVRCKECKHWLKDFPGCTDAIGRCEWANYMVGVNGYCVYGERKNKNENESDAR